MDWFSQAQTLPLGQKVRTDCECGTGKTLVINHRNNSYSTHCFRCDFNEWKPKGTQTLEELSRIRELNKSLTTLKQDAQTLPDDFTDDIPLEGRLWLYGAGITPTIWKQNGIGFSPKLHRVVLPVFRKGKLIWHQSRGLLAGQKPKYIQPSGQRNDVMFELWNHKSTKVILVEDILSAIRVSKYENVASLLGTKMTTEQAVRLAQFKTVVTWLDSDRAGVEGAAIMRRLLSTLTEVGNIETKCDPKKLSNKRIKKMLEGK